MTLSALIRKRSSQRPATAISAIPATQQAGSAVSVAKIATIAVASPEKTGTPETVSASCWLLHFTDRDPLMVYCAPAANHAEILSDYPDAVAAEPVQDRPASDRHQVSDLMPGDAPADDWPTDDRISCRSCSNLEPAGACRAARRGELADMAAGRAYRPPVDVLRRCEAFVPLLGDEDQRTAAERWPGLLEVVR